MSNKSIQPSTLEGIKRLAKAIKAEQSIQHMHALDLASQAAGFQNFRNASNVLKSGTTPSRYNIFLTACWKEGDFKGREMLTIELSSPWGDLITSTQLQNHRAFINFYDDGPDHLSRYKFLDSQSEARRKVCAAARVLQFMDATKLRPSSGYSRAYPKGDTSKAIPGEDHSSVWYDRNTKRYLLVDEPYEAAVERLAAEREAWSKQHDFAVVRPKWKGMYAPDIGSRLCLISNAKKGIPLQPIIAALNKLPLPIVEEMWKGESVPFEPFFISPGKRAQEEAANPQRKTHGQQSSMEHKQSLSGPKRLPKLRVPIAAHAEVGRLLKSVLAVSYYRKGVYNRIDQIRSDLDDLASRDYNYDELPNEQFMKLYYRGSGSTFSRSLSIVDRDHHIATLEQVKKLLIEHFPDSTVKKVFKKLESAVKSLQSWT